MGRVFVVQGKATVSTTLYKSDNGALSLLSKQCRRYTTLRNSPPTRRQKTLRKSVTPIRKIPSWLPPTGCSNGQRTTSVYVSLAYLHRETERCGLPSLRKNTYALLLPFLSFFVVSSLLKRSYCSAFLALVSLPLLFLLLSLTSSSAH